MKKNFVLRWRCVLLWNCSSQKHIFCPKFEEGRSKIVDNDFPVVQRRTLWVIEKHFFMFQNDDMSQLPFLHKDLISWWIGSFMFNEIYWKLSTSSYFFEMKLDSALFSYAVWVLCTWNIQKLIIKMRMRYMVQLIMKPGNGMVGRATFGRGIYSKL